ncbi:hypothetical protein Hamer_G004070 [Homarus americanus]|uniref:Uncharacterized protein n=1 Tax=Homarus americanus TaxID=6706 RepID=A0A8J5MQ67_HOMAM|nr:hypothetical protein Hamer_G004070 [Homarus americanus]
MSQGVVVASETPVSPCISSPTLMTPGRVVSLICLSLGGGDRLGESVPRVCLFPFDRMSVLCLLSLT